MDVVEEVKSGRAKFEWSEVRSEHQGNVLYVSVFRDAMRFGGVRVPASAIQMQKIADELTCMLMTPKVVDMIWLQAGIRFDPVYRIGKSIVADCTVEAVHAEIEKRLEAAGGDDGKKLIDSVGKYWVLTNKLANPSILTYRERNACNYGWCSSDGIYRGVTEGVKVWQSPGYRHNDVHMDPSQTIRLMYRFARLFRRGVKEEEHVDLHDVLRSKDLAPLVSHEGTVTYLRQKAVPEPAPLRMDDGTIVLPETDIYAMPGWQDRRS